MDGDKRFYQRPWFAPFTWTALSLIWYAVNLYRMKLGVVTNYLIYLILDAVIFGVGMLIWMAFFAQFVLPVLRFRERQKIFDRLISHAMGGHGPAIFVEDGVPKFGKGEKEKKGAGVYWLDSASAVQLRTNTKFTRTLGPGVHFTNRGEYMAGVVDLHQQLQAIGPTGKDKPFDPKPDDMSSDEYEAIQKRRNETSALTRDGIEVIPNITVFFKIDADPVDGDAPGSRFGYREVEKPEDNPVFKAIAGEGFNPSPTTLPPEKQLVAWNRLPALIAADLWREYLSKFAHLDLFESIHEIPPAQPAPLAPTFDETTALFEPVTFGAKRNFVQDFLAELAHEMNRILLGWINWLEGGTAEKKAPAKSPPPPPAPGGGGKEKTALEVISAMIRARLTQEKVEVLDSNGRRIPKMDDKGNIIGYEEAESKEYNWLKNRGLRVNIVSVSNLRFAPSVEEQLVRRWNANWLKNAKDESDAINRLRSQKELLGQEEGRNTYTHTLARKLLQKRPTDGHEILRHLLNSTRDELIRQDRLHRLLNTEITDINDILTWLEQ